MIKIKYNLKITLVIIGMFLVTQLIGLYVVGHYTNSGASLPYGMGVPAYDTQGTFYGSYLSSIVVAFVFAIIIFFLLSRFKLAVIMRIWFFFVVMIALGITLTSFFPNIPHFSLIALIFVLPLAILKTYKHNLLVHNITELFIYPGIAAVFVPLLNFWTMAFLVIILIPLYDMWAVWRSGLMQKMAKYQINEVKVFGGFFVPYLSKKTRDKLKKIPKDEIKKIKVKAEVAILGGGDVIFPIIATGVMMKYFGLLSGILTIAGALLGLSYLLFVAKKKKFYPAMPFISSGILLGILVSWLFL